MQVNALQKFLEYKSKKDTLTSPLSQKSFSEVLENRKKAVLQHLESKHKPMPDPEVPKKPGTPEEPLFPPESPKRIPEQTTCSIQLYSKDEVLLKTSAFLSPALKRYIYEAAGIYCTDVEGWIIPISMFEFFVSSTQDLRAFKFQKIPNFVIKALESNKPQVCKQCPHNYQSEISKSLDSLPTHILSQLYNFQKEGVEFGLKHFGRVLIGDEMGIGKTVQGIAIATAYREDWPCIVICPASIKLNWMNEFRRWVPDLETQDFYFLDKKATMRNSAKVWISSYHMATNLEVYLNSKYFKVAIADESHYLKNYSAKRTKCLVPFLQKAKRVILLSGTPVVSRPAELYTQLSAIRPDIFNNFKVYAERYCDPKVLFTHTDYSGASNIKELYTLISNTVMIRRIKSEVLSQLPDKFRQKVEIPVTYEYTRKIKKLYFDVRKKKEYFKETHEVTGDEVDSAAKNLEKDLFFTQAFTLTCKAKLKGVVDYVSYLIQSNCKFMFFGHHLEMLDAVETQVNKEKTKYIRIDGSTPHQKRQAGVNAFQNNSDCKVAILGIMAAGQGLTLTEASTVVMGELAWTPGVMIQAEDRAHRIGQKRCVNIHYLYGPQTLDEYIWPKLQAKLNIVSGTLDNGNNHSMDSFLNPQERLGMGQFDTSEVSLPVKRRI